MERVTAKYEPDFAAGGFKHPGEPGYHSPNVEVDEKIAIAKTIANLGILYHKMTQAEKDIGIECMLGMKRRNKMDEKKEQAKHLAEEHWEWIKKLLDTQLLITERLFKDGFKHGWKHAKTTP